MNKIQGLLFCLLMFFSSIALAQKLSTQSDSLHYSIGYKAGMELNSIEKSEFDFEKYLDGFKAAFDDKAAIDKDVINEIVNKFKKELKQKKLKMVKEEGEKFLAENANKEGVTTTSSGLQYKVITKGTGTRNPKATDKVLTHYHGTLIDGTLFDSSVERGEPISFGLNQVIPGWTEGLQLMSEGDKYRFYIPYDLAYGSRGAGAVIPPYSTLIFDVELIEILD